MKVVIKVRIHPGFFYPTKERFDMEKLIIVFFASFFLVFLLGFQQLNVTHRKYVLAAITSIGMTLSNYLLFKVLPEGGLDLVQFFFYALGGSLGIVIAMWSHDRIFPKV